MAPFFAFGHGAQFVLGKVTPHPNGRVMLELTADYGENPMIQDLDGAREALENLMEWRCAGESPEMTFEALPPARFEQRNTFDSTIPLPTTEDELFIDHSLLTGIWEWRPEADGIELRVKRGTPLDVLLWTQPRLTDLESTRWAILIAGDVSPVIRMAGSSGVRSALWWFVGAGGLVLAAVAITVARRRTKVAE